MSLDAAQTQSTSGPLNPADVISLQSSAVLFRSVQKAIGYARFNGLMMIVFGSIAVLSGLDSMPATGTGAVLVSCGLFELRQRARLVQLERSSLLLLALNQFVAAIAVTVYCLFNFLNPAVIDMPPELAGTPELADSLAHAQAMATSLVSLVYLASMGITWLVQLIAACFYLSRRGHLSRYLTQSPPWVHNLQRKGLLRAA